MDTVENIVYVPYRITRAFIRLHQDWSFVYGNVWGNHIRKGQAEQALGEPNAFYVPTRHLPCTCAHSLWNDFNFSFWLFLFEDCLNDIPRDKPIMLFPKIGTGGSSLNLAAPKIYRYMTEKLNEIKCPWIVINPYMQPYKPNEN